MDAPANLVGQLLLALPGIGDPRFDHAVIAMCAHDPDGAMGIGVGEVVRGIGLHDIFAQLEIDPGETDNAPVHVGGPVEPRRGFVLHSLDWGGQDTIEVAGLWALSGNVDILRAIAEGRGPRRWLVALGYAGWSEGQLDEEMTRPGWFTCPGAPDLIFDTPAEKRWGGAFARQGIDPRLLVSGSGNA